jgi:hypothetical protein
MFKKGAFMFRIKWPLCVLLALFSIVVGCESEDDDDSSTSGSVVPGVIDAAGGFNVKVNPPTGVDYYIHKSGDFDSSCSVAANETSYANQDITCIVEVEELTGAANGIKMVLNSQPGMCKYVWHYPFFYFGEDYGQGPTAVVANFDAAGNFSAAAVAAGPVSSITGAGTFGPDGSVRCNYDYSTDEGPDCCYGDYTLRTITPTSDTTETKSWTGKPGNCVSGSGGVTAPRYTPTNMPLGYYYPSKVGYNEEFDTGKTKIINPIDSSLFYANYYSGAAPAAFKLAGTYPGNPYYTWMCLDDASEIVARIRVQIREWNSAAEFELEASGDPDATGAEPNWGDAVNDHQDWLDVITGGDGFPGMAE